MLAASWCRKVSIRMELQRCVLLISTMHCHPDREYPDHLAIVAAAPEKLFKSRVCRIDRGR